MLDSRYVRFVVETGKSSTIAASKLSGLDRFTIAADDGALDSTAYVVVRDGDDLVMLFADGTRVVIEDYFTSTASFAFDGLGQDAPLRTSLTARSRQLDHGGQKWHFCFNP